MSAACDLVYGCLFLLLTITNFTDRGQKNYNLQTFNTTRYVLGYINLERPV